MMPCSPVPVADQRLQVIVYGLSVIEIYTILQPIIPLFARLQELLRSGEVYIPAYEISDIRITPAFFVAICLLALSALLRLACYRELGRAFTYELAIRKEHRLVTTGPYAVVRHPSYTALLLHFPLAMLSQAGPGSWWYESGGWGTAVGKVAGAFWAVFSACFCIFFLQRASNEDKIMRKEFGNVWDEWARHTPYKFIPYIL